MKLLPPTILLLLFASCAEQEQKKDALPHIKETEEKKTPEPYFDFSTSDLFKTDTIGWVGEEPEKYFVQEFKLSVEMVCLREPYYVEVATFDRKVKLSFNFGEVEFLQQVFGSPVGYLHNDAGYDSLVVSWWYCKNCKADSIPYLDNNSLGKVFPDPEVNTTWVNGMYDFTFEEMNYRIVSFASYPGEFAVSFTGRYSGAVMGYALLDRNSTGGWRIIDFNPAVGMYGNYNYPNEPIVKIVNDRAFLIYECSNGGPGEPYTTLADIYVYDRKKMNHIAHETFLGCHNNALGEWESEYKFFHHSGMEIPGLCIVTHGYYTGANSPKEIYPFVFNGIYPPLLDSFRKAENTKKPIQFIFKKMYSGNYGTRMGQGPFQLQTKKLKGNWVTN